MKSQTSDVFWKHYRTLPLDVRRRAREAYKLWSKNPRQPGLFFKRVEKIARSILFALVWHIERWVYWRTTPLRGFGLVTIPSMIGWLNRR